jgi:excinuclease UvrABC nuclease subunit
MKKYTYSCIDEIKPIQIFTKLNIEANLKACQDQLKEKSGIYGIINLHQNKIYIGKSTNIFERFKQHIKKSSNTPLRNAINNDGLHNFAFVVFVFVESHFVGNNFNEELSNLEIKFIKSFDPNLLYNIILHSSRGNNMIICTKNTNFVPGNLVLKCINKTTLAPEGQGRGKLSIYQLIKTFLILF